MTPGHHGSEDCVAKSKDGPREVVEVILLEVDFGIFFFFSLGIAYSRLTQ